MRGWLAAHESLRPGPCILYLTASMVLASVLGSGLTALLAALSLAPVAAQPPDCTVAVVGAGPGGIYFAMRLAEANKTAAGSICIFERAQRPGGRIYSLRGMGPHQDLCVEMVTASRHHRHAG